MKPAIPRTKCHGIPAGRGPFVVGVADIMSDNSVTGTFTRLYYPTNQTSEGVKETKQPLWIPNCTYTEGYCKFIGFNGRISKWIFNRMFGNYRVAAVLHADVSKPTENQSFPVVVFSHGLGAMRTTYSTIHLDLASQGFIVAAVEHRDKSACSSYFLEKRSNPDASKYEEKCVEFIKVKDKTEEDFKIRNNQVNQRADECIRALDLLVDINNGQQIKNYLGEDFDLTQFKGLLNLDKISVVGHSFGGATTIQAIQKEPRFKVGVALDAWMYPLEKSILSSIKQPLLLINTEKFQWPANVAKQYLLVNPTSQTDDRKMITLRGTVHESQCDFTFITGKFIGKAAELRGDADPYDAMDHNNNALIAFISRQLGIDYDTDLDKMFTNGHFEEVIQGTNVKFDPERLPKPAL